MSEKQNCLNCKFFLENPGVPEGGLCRRMPPQIAWGMTPQGNPVPAGSGYPPTLYNSWCGEWQQGTRVKAVSAMPDERPWEPSAN
jgi:hypothetical protein